MVLKQQKFIFQTKKVVQKAENSMANFQLPAAQNEPKCKNIQKPQVTFEEHVLFSYLTEYEHLNLTRRS